MKKERKLKTDPRVLARQRESYHKRKQRRQSNEIIRDCSGSEANPSPGNWVWVDQLISYDDSSVMTHFILGKQQHTPNGQPEKGKPWCNVPNRKTPTHILQRRRDASYRRKEQKLFETNGQSKSRYVALKTYSEIRLWFLKIYNIIYLAILLYNQRKKKS